MKKQGVVILAILLAHSACWAMVVGQRSAGPPQPGPEEKRLGYFVGKWKQEVDVKPSALGPGHKGTSIQTCDWFPGGFQVVCHGDFTGTVGERKDLALFSYNREEKLYFYYQIISDGDQDSSKGTVQGDTWTWQSEAKVVGKVIKGRFIYKEVSADRATMTYEIQSDDGKWNLVMEMKASRVR